MTDEPDRAVSPNAVSLQAELLEERRARRCAEQALRESQATLLLGERINRSGSWRWDVARGLVHCSAGFCRILELDPDPDPGPDPERGHDAAPAQIGFDALLSRVHPNDRATVKRVLGDGVARRRPVRFEHRLRGLDGRILYLAVAGQPMGDTDPGVYVGTVSDISGRRADEDALRRAQAALAQGARMSTVGQLTAAIAHEVNQPLMAIGSHAGAGLRWLRHAPPRLDQVEHLLQEIAGQGERAGRIIQALQALGRRSPQSGSVDLHALIGETLALARGELERHEIALDLDLRAPHAVLEGDAVQLQQVLVNLVENAIEALAQVSGRARLLRLCTAAAGDEGGTDGGTGGGTGSGLALRVEDNGPGIAPALLAAAGPDAIFEPFVSTRPGAIGMGLAVCRSIVEAHGGTIHAQARTPYGCRVLVRLPGGQ